MAYFERIDEHRFDATEHTGGAWDLETQHIAPALGLLTHAIEKHSADELTLARLSFDIFGTVPIEPVEVTTSVLRPGRTIELVEARLSHGGRVIVSARGWRLAASDTVAVAGTTFDPIPGPDELPSWDPSSAWPGGFIASAEVRRDQVEPGRAVFWVRTGQALIEGEEVSSLAATVGLLDIANGMTVRAQPNEVLFPNIDLTAHFFRRPVGGWVGFDTRVSFGPAGVGLTSSVIHDVDGPVGTSNQILTVRPI